MSPTATASMRSAPQPNAARPVQSCEVPPPERKGSEKLVSNLRSPGQNATQWNGAARQRTPGKHGELDERRRHVRVRPPGVVTGGVEGGRPPAQKQERDPRARDDPARRLELRVRREQGHQDDADAGRRRDATGYHRRPAGSLAVAVHQSILVQRVLA